MRRKEEMKEEVFLWGRKKKQEGDWKGKCGRRGSREERDEILAETKEEKGFCGRK